MGLEKLSSNVWSHYLKIYVWLEGRALYLLRFVSFSPFIIIEESNLQRFSHSLVLTLDGYLDHTVHLIFKECVCFFDPV